MAEATTDFEAQAEEARAAARAHMRAARRHRKAAKDKYAQMDVIIREAARRGICITIDNAKPIGETDAGEG